MTEYTPNYNLDLYENTDKPNLRDQYNSAMRKIDNTFTTQNTNIGAASTVATAANEAAQNAVTTANAANTLAQTADGKADTNATNIATLRTDLTSETNARVAADANLQTQLDNISVGSGSGFKDANIIWIGDSWTRSGVYGVTKPHQETVSEILEFGNMYGSFIGSRGYCRYDSTRPTYATSLQDLANDSSFDNNSINFIIIEGSINDSNYTKQQIIDAMVSCWDYAKRTFTNAKLIVVPTIGNNTHTADWEKCALANREGAIEANVQYIKGGHWLLWQMPSIWNPDNVHPNQTGQDIIAKALVQGLQTGNMNINIDTSHHVTQLTNFNLINSSGGYFNIIGSELRLIDRTIQGVIGMESGRNANIPWNSITPVWYCDIENICTDAEFFEKYSNYGNTDTYKLYRYTQWAQQGSTVLAAGVTSLTNVFTDKVVINAASNINNNTSYVAAPITLGYVLIGVND